MPETIAENILQAGYADEGKQATSTGTCSENLQAISPRILQPVWRACSQVLDRQADTIKGVVAFSASKGAHDGARWLAVIKTSVLPAESPHAMIGKYQP